MSYLLVDTHCHLDFDKFDEDRDAVMERAREAGVNAIIAPGLDIKTSENVIALTEKYPEVYAAVGLHPQSMGKDPAPLDQAIEVIRKLGKHKKTVAIGEIGLDYYWDTTPHDIQHVWLKAHLALASELKKPVILHNRESTADIISVLENWVSAGLPDEIAGRPGVLHSFSGTWDDAIRVLDMGFYIGITGPITFKKAEELRRVAQNTPAHRLLIETDAPFLTPHPYRGKRNEPSYTSYIIEKLAEVRGVTVETIAKQTTENALNLFDLSLSD